MPRYPWEDDEDLTVGEIKDAHIRENSAVDHPATARRFRMYKRRIRARKEDLAGIYGAEGARETGGSASELVDLERCLANNPDADPALCEAMAAAGGLAELLEGDMSGDDAQVSDPPTSGDFNTAGKWQQKPEAVEDCVAAILEDPAFDEGEYESREQRAYAICQSQFGRLGGPAMPRKQDELPEEPGAAPASMDVAEVPSTPEEWPLVQCISDAMDKGLGDEDSAALCMMLREKFGDPKDPNIMLIPEGLSTDSLLTTSAIDLGLLKPEGGGSEEPAVEAEMMLRAPEKNASRPVIGRYWLDKLEEMLGRKRPKTHTEKQLAWLRREVMELRADAAAQVKKNADLLRIIEGLHRMLGAALGVPVETVTEQEEIGPAGPAPPPVTPAPEPKRAKDEPPATLEEALELINTLTQRITTLETTMRGDELEEEQEAGDEIEAALTEAATAAELDMGPEPMDEPATLEEALELKPVAVADVPMAEAAPDPFKRGTLRRKRTSVPPKAGPGAKKQPEMQVSGILVDPSGRGALIPREDLKQLGW